MSLASLPDIDELREETGMDEWNVIVRDDFARAESYRVSAGTAEGAVATASDLFERDGLGPVFEVHVLRIVP